MLTRSPEGLESALDRLAPDDRALLELSMLRGVSDVELATLLRVEPYEVERRREVALRRLGDDGASLFEDGRPANRVTDLPQDLEAAAEPPHPLRTRRARLALIALGGALAAIVAVMVLSGGEDNEPRLGAEPQSRPPEPAPNTPPGASSPAPGVKLEPAAGATKAAASARIEGDRLELRVRGLPRSSGGYALWLYDSVAEAAPVARFDIPGARISARLPENFERYRYLDLSLEPRNGNPNHSGESVLRVPLERLR